MQDGTRETHGLSQFRKICGIQCASPHVQQAEQISLLIVKPPRDIDSFFDLCKILLSNERDLKSEVNVS